MKNARIAGGAAAVVALMVAVSSCSGGSPSSPSGGNGGGGGGGTNPPPTATNTITITSSGVSPRSITVTPGSRVTFINSDSRQHEIGSDPHPEHTDCPALNDVGFLAAGQQRTSGNLNTARTCRYHDHQDPFNTNLQGTIVIQ